MGTIPKMREQWAEEQGGSVGPTDEEVYRTPGREFAEETEGLERKGFEEENREEAAQRERGVLGAARERGESFFKGQKQFAAAEIGHYGNALHAAADRLQQERASLARAAETAANQLDQLSRYVSSHSANELFRSANAYAQRHPGVVWGSMLFAGFAFSRFLKSTEESRQSGAGEGELR